MLSAARPYLAALLLGVCAITPPLLAHTQTLPGTPAYNTPTDAVALFDANLARGANPVPGHLILPKYAYNYDHARADRRQLQRALGARGCHRHMSSGQNDSSAAVPFSNFSTSLLKQIFEIR